MLKRQYSIILWLPYFSTKNSTGSLITLLPSEKVICLFFFFLCLLSSFFSLPLFFVSFTPTCLVVIFLYWFWSVNCWLCFRSSGTLLTTVYSHVFSVPLEHSLLGLNYRCVRTFQSLPYFANDLFCVFRVFCSLQFSLEVSCSPSLTFSVVLQAIYCETYLVRSQIQLSIVL